MKKIKSKKIQKKKNSLVKGDFLRENVFNFILNEKLNSTNVAEKLHRLIERIKMTETIFSVIKLPPGFDILVGLKESHIVFSYWEEYDYVRLNLASCKKYEVEDIIKFLKHNFKIKSKIKIEFISDYKIKEIVEELCQERF